MTTPSAELQVQRTISRFMNSFDLKNWDTMRRLLADVVRVDYSALRGEPPRTITAEEFVSARIAALQALQTHHLIANFDIEARSDSADAQASCVIHRTDPSKDGAQFTSHAYYRFGLELHGSQWKIHSITQSIFWNEGDPGLHSGVSK